MKNSRKCARYIANWDQYMALKEKPFLLRKIQIGLKKTLFRRKMMISCMKIMTTITISAVKDKVIKHSDPKIKTTESVREAAITTLPSKTTHRCRTNTKMILSYTMPSRPRLAQ